jgi:PAS domain S-box-containing protein
MCLRVSDLGEPLKILLVADSEDDTKRLLDQLASQGFSPTWERVSGARDLTAALERGGWDVLLACSSGAALESVPAFHLAHRMAPRLPFVLIADSADEAALVLAAEAGIEEFVFRDRLSRLVPSIRKSIRAKWVRQERERALARLRASEARFRRLIEESHQCIVIHRDFKPVFANRALVETLGFDSVDEVLAVDTVYRWIAPEEHPRLKAFAEARLRGEAAPAVYEFQAIRKDGSRLWLQNVSQVVDWEGSAAIQSVYVDVTDRHRAEAALRESEARFKLMAEQTQDVVYRYRLKPDRAFEFMSQSVAAFVGYTPEEFYADADLGTRIVHPDDRARLEEALSNPERMEGPVVLRWVGKGGAPIWTEFRNRIIRDESGRPVAIQGIGRDVSERVRGEEKLRSIVEGSIQGILVHRNMQPLFANTAYARLHGYDLVEEVLGLESVIQLVAPEERDRLRGYGRERLAGREVPSRYEYRALRRDGSAFWVEHMARVIPWEDGAPAILATFVDVTARKLAEAGLHESEERYRLLAENAQDVIFRFRLRPERGFDYVSPSCRRLCGYSPEEYLADSELPLRIVHPDDRHILESYFRDPPVQPATLTVRLFNKDGALLWVEQRNSVVTDAQGVPVAIEGVVRDIGERMQREEMFRLVVESAPYGMLIVDAEGRIVQVNAQLERDFRYSREELAGQSMEMLVPESARAVHAGHVREFFRQPRLRPMGAGLKLQGRRKDGTEFPVDISLAPFTSTQGHLVLATVRDVTDRQRAEDALRASEARFRGLIEETNLPILVHRDFRPLFANRAYARLYGFESPEAVLSLPDVTGTIVPEEVEEARQAYRGRLNRAPMPEFLERQSVRRDGTRFWVRVIANRIDWEGEPAVLAAFMDISDRRRAEDLLRSQQTLMQAVFDSVPLWITVKDARGRYLLVNRRVAEEFGQTQEWYRGKTVADLPWGSDEEKRAVREYDERAMAGGEIVTTDAVRFTDPRGNTRELAVVRVPLRDSAGAVSGLATVSQDVTERHSLQEQLAASQRIEAVGRLAGGVAHDFNNILAVILSYSQFVLDRLPSGGPEREDLQQVITAAERASALTRQLLAFSRRQTFELRVMNLNDVVENLDKMLRRLIGEDIQFVTRLEEHLWPVRADATQIDQVILNLAVNARDAMPSGGRLIVETANAVLDEEYVRQHVEAVPGEYVLLTVTDTGTGMDESVRKRIFEPFFTTKEQGKGTGLGLATVYGIVKQLEGFIWVYSEPGRGTAFKIYLPRAADSLGTAGVTAASVPTPGRNETVLLVEDNEPVRHAGRRILEKHGYRVLEAEDARNALALCEDRAVQVDLLLSDVVMPEISGPELANRVRVVRPGLRVAFMSGYPDDAMTQHGLDAGRVRLLQKPFTSDSLLKLVREVLDEAQPPLN